MATFILLPLFFYPQLHLFKILDNINTHIKSNSVYQTRTISCSLGDKIYFTDCDPVKDKDKLIYSYDIKTRAFNHIKIERTPSTSSIFTNALKSFLFIEDKAILINNEYIYTFRLTKNELHLIKRQENRKSFSNIYKLNDKECFLYVNYNFHPMDAEDRHLWAKYFITNDSAGSLQKMGEENIKFSHFVNSWISTYKGLIAYSNTTNYLIRIYDDKFKVIDSISTNELDQNSKVLTKTLGMYSKSEIMSFQKLDDSTMTRIQKIFLLDSSSILVMKKLPKPNLFSVDLWKKINDKWILKHQEEYPGFYIAGQQYTKENQRCFNLSGNMIGIETFRNIFYFVSYPFMKEIITDHFDLKNDYYDVVNELARKNELFYGLSKYNLVID